MTDNIPRASIHVGDDKKSFSAQVSNEAERRGWDEKRYQLKNAEEDKNNHYNFSRKHLNFEITKGGKIVPLGSNPVPLHERLQQRHDELGFKPYMDADHPGQLSKYNPNCLVNIIFGGDHDVMKQLAFGDQELDTYDPNADQSHITLQHGVYDWALDTYNFACRKWGDENVVGFDVHCDEISIHAHVLTIPVEQVKKRGRIASEYVKNDNPSVRLSTKDWKALPKDERALYTKTEASKGLVERVSYAKVWGETRKEKSAYLSQLHTDYHDEVGYKYGLERGIPYEELSDEEQRERKHKSKVVLEAERQAKLAVANAMQAKQEMELRTEAYKEERNEIIHEAQQAWQMKENAEKALDSMKDYAALAMIDKKELRFPLLDLSLPIKTAKDAVAQELAIKIPNLLGQKEWRNDRITNINAIIETLVTAINEKRDEQNAGVRESVNKQYTYYMQQLNKLIETNKSLHVQNEAVIKENNTIKAENARVKQRISELDENAVARVTAKKDAVISQLNSKVNTLQSENTSLKADLSTLEDKHNQLVDRWNNLWKEPEFNEAWNLYQSRKKREQREAEERRAVERKARQAAEREARIIADRKTNILNRFITEGRQAQREFALSTRSWDFNNSESLRIYYAIIALAKRDNISLTDKSGTAKATNSFLDGCDWSGMSSTRINCCKSWTNLLTAKEVTFPDGIVTNFIDFVDTMSCSASTYQSLMGSNGCADQLTNWDGTQKRGLGAPTKKDRGMPR